MSILLRISSIFLAITFLGCSVSNEKISALDLYNKVEIYMGREKVESILGEPEYEFRNEVYYLHPPQIKDDESPIHPGSVLIIYFENRVHEKHYLGKE